MNQPEADERVLTTLRIEVDPFPENARAARFTMVDEGGESLTAPISLREGELENLHDVFAKIAAHNSPAAGALPFGMPDEARVILGFDDYVAPNFLFYCTIALPSGDGGYQPTTGRALVPDAALARLVDGLRQVKDAGQGTVDWTVAD
ncbi:hypothetical protein [Massilia sp. METH4]|uniref:hypothetical protein n=1 Tax=Massilia sp. METH4 TaxID=3123041 RepID=UPI0030D27BC7